jgi:hypothetical protein
MAFPAGVYVVSGDPPDLATNQPVWLWVVDLLIIAGRVMAFPGSTIIAAGVSAALTPEIPAVRLRLKLTVYLIGSVSPSELHASRNPKQTIAANARKIFFFMLYLLKIVSGILSTSALIFT